MARARAKPEERRTGPDGSAPVADERCRRVVSLLLAGYRHAQVAKREGWTTAELWEYLGQPHVRAYRYTLLQAARDATVASVVAHAEDAVHALSGSLRSDDERVRVEAARQILDRAGVVRTERVEQAHEVSSEASVVAALDAQLPRRLRLDADTGWVAELAARVTGEGDGGDE